MTIQTFYHIPSGEQVFIAATLANPGTLVILLSTGDVVKYTISNQTPVYLFSIKSAFTYLDGDLDIMQNLPFIL